MPHVQTNSLIVSNKKRKDDSEVTKLQRCYDCNEIGHNDKRCRYKQQAMKKREIKVVQTGCLHVTRLTTRDYVVSTVAAQGLCNRHPAKITTNDEPVTSTTSQSTSETRPHTEGKMATRCLRIFAAYPRYS